MRGRKSEVTEGDEPAMRVPGVSTPMPATYDAYLAWMEGLDLFSRTDYRAAIPALTRAASLDSTFVTPRIWTMAAYGNMGESAPADSITQTLMPLHAQMTRYDRGLFDLWIGVTRGDIQAQYAAGHDMLAAAPGSELAIFLAGTTALYANHIGEAIDLLEQTYNTIDKDRKSVV